MGHRDSAVSGSFTIERIFSRRNSHNVSLASALVMMSAKLGARRSPDSQTSSYLARRSSSETWSAPTMGMSSVTPACDHRAASRYSSRSAAWASSLAWGTGPFLAGRE